MEQLFEQLNVHNFVCTVCSTLYLCVYHFNYNSLQVSSLFCVVVYFLSALWYSLNYLQLANYRIEIKLRTFRKCDLKLCVMILLLLVGCVNQLLAIVVASVAHLLFCSI